MKPRLFHNRMAFSSQIARLAAANYGVEIANVEVDIGPSHENYDPKYMSISCKSGSAHGKAPKMHQVPVVRVPIDCAVLAHRRNRYSVFERDVAQGEG